MDRGHGERLFGYLENRFDAALARLIVEELARQRGFALDIVQEIDEPKTITEMVRVGFGIGVLGYTGIAERGVATARPITDRAAFTLSALEDFAANGF